MQRGDQGKFFKNRPKRSFPLKGPTVVWRKWHYPLISMHLKCKDWKRFWRKNTAPKVSEWPSYGNFGKITQNPHFLKTCRRKFFQNRSKSTFRLKEPTGLWRKWDYPLNSLRLKCKDWKRFWCKQRLQKCPYGQVIAIFARSPKTRIFWKSAKGGPREIFQKSPKT